MTLTGSGGSGKSRLALAAEADDAHCVEELAGLNAEGGEPERAARLIGASEALLETAGAPLRSRAGTRPPHGNQRGVEHPAEWDQRG